MFKYFLFLFVFCSLSYFSQAQVFKSGEELEYKVSFMGLDIGRIKMISENEEDFNGPVYKAKCLISSNDDIPFVKIKATFQSWMDKSLDFSKKWTANTYMTGSGWIYQELVSNPEGKMTIKRWNNKKKDLEKEFEMKKWNEGLSIFYFARNKQSCGKKLTSPTIINAEGEKTIFNFYKKIEEVEVDAINYPVRTSYMTGKADWEGVYGLKGDFEGWFSDDDARVPILAYLNVLVGKVKIELIKWNRPGWVPPKKHES